LTDQNILSRKIAEITEEVQYCEALVQDNARLRLRLQLDESDIVLLYGEEQDFYCFDLTEVRFGGLDLSEVRDISYLFSCCGALEAVNLHCFNDSPLEHAESMFLCCDRLYSVGSNLDLIANELIYMPEPQYPAEWDEEGGS